ncbi:MAG TPA: hypothetical protein VN780_01205, partial [Candidatus Eisenbacteria bacterium]|nr:hypothetical protein [Candidatus Eisenbacteria bacterium]
MPPSPRRSFTPRTWRCTLPGLANSIVKHALLWVILACMPVRSLSVPQGNRPSPPASVVDSPDVRAAVSWFSRNLSWINDQQSRLTEIPAPPFQEAQRAAAVKALLASSGLTVQLDKTGNVIGELSGANEKEIVM